MLRAAHSWCQHLPHHGFECHLYPDVDVARPFLCRADQDPSRVWDHAGQPQCAAQVRMSATRPHWQLTARYSIFSIQREERWRGIFIAGSGNAAGHPWSDCRDYGYPGATSSWPMRTLKISLHFGLNQISRSQQCVMAQKFSDVHLGSWFAVADSKNPDDWHRESTRWPSPHAHLTIRRKDHVKPQSGALGPMAGQDGMGPAVDAKAQPAKLHSRDCENLAAKYCEF